jgi:hypothetical protein
LSRNLIREALEAKGPLAQSRWKQALQVSERMSLGATSAFAAGEALIGNRTASLTFTWTVRCWTIRRTATAAKRRSGSEHSRLGARPTAASGWDLHVEWTVGVARRRCMCPAEGADVSLAPRAARARCTAPCARDCSLMLPALRPLSSARRRRQAGTRQQRGGICVLPLRPHHPLGLQLCRLARRARPVHTRLGLTEHAEVRLPRCCLSEPDGACTAVALAVPGAEIRNSAGPGPGGLRATHAD